MADHRLGQLSPLGQLIGAAPPDSGAMQHQLASGQARQSISDAFGLGAGAAIGQQYISPASFFEQEIAQEKLRQLAARTKPKTLREELQTEINEWLKDIK
jgi:hypothetical protein